jgi:D-arabinose 1-dehydrogenase-like Zn-dependent alcohol dehydrogenase
MSAIPTTLSSLTNTVQASLAKMSLPKTYKAAVFTEKGGQLKIQERELKLPQRGEVLAKVLATGVCASDLGAQGGHFGNSFPLVPGHETIGDVVAVGEGEDVWKVGDRVGAPWHGGHCGMYFA